MSLYIHENEIRRQLMKEPQAAAIMQSIVDLISHLSSPVPATAMQANIQAATDNVKRQMPAKIKNLFKLHSTLSDKKPSGGIIYIG